jgi:hypothetical protein
MKKLVAVGLVVGLLGGAMVLPADAAKKKAKPVATTLYLHGNYPVGDGAELAGTLQGTRMMMNPTAPTDPAPKSMSVWAPGNDQCAGNPFYPSWEGMVSGTIKGDVKMIADFVSAPTQLTARIWIDTPFMACTSSNTGATDFQEPLQTVTVDIPPGQNEVEIVFEGINKKAVANMIVELHVLAESAPNQARVLYDSTDFQSRVEFSCIPASGTSCTP